MILGDADIRDRCSRSELVLSPFRQAQVQPASYDLRLGRSFILQRGEPAVELDRLELAPGQFVLACTEEWIELPADLAASLSLRSSYAREGLDHSLAGWVDPGFRGELTLELRNSSDEPIELRPGDRVAQLVFFRLQTPSSAPYGPARGSHYRDQRGATPSRLAAPGR
jgi:dCTP deaminase